MERLEILQMVGCGSVDDVGLRFIANGCPSLKVRLNFEYFVASFWSV